MLSKTNVLIAKPVTDNNCLQKIEFEIYYEENPRNKDEDDFKGTIGIFETFEKSETFAEFMPQIANFFLKKEDQIFLMDEEGRILMKHFKVWETLTPFINSKLKGKLPKLKLVMTGGQRESDLAGGSNTVRLKLFTI